MSHVVLPHPRNAPGDFYVEDGCCISCGMPFQSASALFEYDDGHCYVKRQPASAEEVDAMVDAIGLADVGCIRYKGNQRVIQIRLVEAGEGAQCDELPEDLAAQHSDMSKRRITHQYGFVGRSASQPAKPSALQRLTAWLRRLC